jgi:hypothetical protein
LILPYDSERSLTVIEQHAGELAGVLVEPVQSRNPMLRPGAFLHRLREVTARTGVPLIFDEVITGFRVKPGGAQEWFGVEADIAAYGKCVGGGYPVGVVAGAARYMDTVDGGRWQDGPGAPDAATTYIGSTFEMHPATIAGTLAMMAHLREAGPALQDRLTARTERMATALNAMFRREGAPIQVMNFGSVFRFAWKGNASYAHQPLAIEVFHFHLLLRGIYLWEGRTCFLSTAHTDADVAAVIAAATDAIAAMKDGGFVAVTPGPAVASVQAALLARAEAVPEGPDWTVAEDVELTGPLDVGRLRGSVSAVVARHEALRTVFRDGATARGAEPSLETADLIAERTSIAAWWQDRLAERFDLTAGPLVRFLLVRTADRLHHLVLRAHHVVSDGISMSVLLRELAAGYAGENLGAPARQYTDHVAHLAGRDVARHRAYWVEQFADVPSLPALAAASDEGARHFGRLDAKLTVHAKKAARALGSTLFQVLLTPYGLLTHERFGDDVVFGVPVAGRDYPGGETVVGYCADMLPIRSRLDRDGTVGHYHTALRQTVLDAFAHQLPLSDIKHLLADCAAVLPLRTVFNLDLAVPPPDFGGLSARFCPVPSRAAMVDLRFDLIEADDGILLTADYRREVHSARYVAQWTDRYIATLAAVVTAAPTTPVRDILKEAEC